MKTSDLLKRAETFLWDGSTEMAGKSIALCNALNLATSGQGHQAEIACSRAQNVIMQALGGHQIYCEWAVANGYLPDGWFYNYKQWGMILQANRLNWLRELQRQFKAKGD